MRVQTGLLDALQDFLQVADADQQVVGFDELISSSRRVLGGELPDGGRSKR